METFRIITAVLLLVASGGLMVRAGDAPGALVGGQAVPADEYQWHEARLRAEVAGRLMQQHGIEMTTDFWTTPLDGVTPGQILRRETLRRIARCRAIQELAVENGLLDALKSYGELVNAFNAENFRRREIKANGQVFYGPLQFRQEVWFDIWFDQLERELMKLTSAQQVQETLDARVTLLIQDPQFPKPSTCSHS